MVVAAKLFTHSNSSFWWFTLILGRFKELNKIKMNSAQLLLKCAQLLLLVHNCYCYLNQTQILHYLEQHAPHVAKRAILGFSDHKKDTSFSSRD